MRFARIHELAAATGHLKRFVVFGSLFTAQPEPNDADVFLLMGDGFELTQVTGENRLVFDHLAAQANFQAQVAHLRNTEDNPTNYRAAVGGFLTEIDRMQLEVREYLSLHPRELTPAV
jgi:hypothetical protein